VLACARGVVAIEVLGAVQALAMRRLELPGAKLGAGTAVAFAAFEDAALDRGGTPADVIRRIEDDLATGVLLRAMHDAGFAPEPVA
jgi:hypothetical protein